MPIGPHGGYTGRKPANPDAKPPTTTGSAGRKPTSVTDVTENGALHLLARIREALGDNGRMMQDELLDHCRELAAESYRPAWIQAMAERDEARARVAELTAELSRANDTIQRIAHRQVFGADERVTAERDRYREALERIRDRDVLFDESMSEIAAEALKG